MSSAPKTPSTKTAALREAIAEFGLSSDLDLEAVFSAALRNGGELAELFFEETDSSRVFYEDGKVERVVDGKDRGCGLRILFDNRSVYGYTTDLGKDALESLAQTLSAAVRDGSKSANQSALEEIEWRKTASKSAEIANYRVKESPRSIALKDKVALAERANKSARSILPEAQQVAVIVLDSLRRILVVNSDGVVSKDEKTYLQMAVEVVGKAGSGKDARIESAYETDGGFVGLEFFEKTTPESIAAEAAKRVKVLLTAVPAPSGSMPVVLAAEAGGTMIHEAVGHGLEADLACNGLSVYQGKIGQRVASELITVLDDGTMPERRGSFTFDDEGTPSQKNVLIENGILKGYMVDRISAMKFDLPATGNGRRETFRHKPIVRMTNTYIAPGKDDPAQILKDTKWGVFVQSMGGGQVDTVTGDFVFAVTEGYLIRDGKIAEPIRGATLVGNGPRVLEIVDRVGSDLGFATGTCGKDGQGAPVTDAQPTLRIPELTVGGEVPVSTYWK
jgi:TldD protein